MITFVVVVVLFFYVFWFFVFSSVFFFSTGESYESHGLLTGVRRPMTQDAARRIQSATARSFGGMVPKKSFSSRAQSTADRRAYWNIY